MAEFIHHNGDLYRVWYSVPDQYGGKACSRNEMRSRLVAEGTNAVVVEERLARADANGTSAFNDTRDATKWDTERCDHCSDFHHKFNPRPDGLCRACGETKDDRGHMPLCKAKGGAR